VSGRVAKSLKQDLLRRVFLWVFIALFLSSLPASPFSFGGAVSSKQLFPQQPPSFVGVGLGSVASVAVETVGAVRVVVDGNTVLDSPFVPQLTISQRMNGLVVMMGDRELARGREVKILPTAMHQASLKWKGCPYYGAFECSLRGSSVQLINVVPLEDYVRGVAQAEIGDAPIEAVKAQLVVIRSEVIHKLNLRRHAAEGFDFCTDNHCMAYRGAKDENQNLIEASRATAGLVLTNRNGVLDAVFHCVCGGVTAGAEDVWSSPAIEGLSSVLDCSGNQQAPDLSSEEAATNFILNPLRGSFCDSQNAVYPRYAQKYFRWRKELSGEELSKLAGVGRVTEIFVKERRRSGRVRRLQVIGERGTRVFEKELPIRNAFGLWSGLFILQVYKAGGWVQRVEFVGAGNGHGVGLCQMGAWSMARQGYSFERILQHYYPGARLQKLY